MNVSIIILHFKSNKDTLACLASVSKLVTKGFNTRVILIDNDGLSKTKGNLNYESCKKLIPNLIIIRSPKNLGFAKGVNTGIRKALKDKKTEYVLILNNDTIIPAELLTVMLRQPIDIAQPLIKFKSLKGQWLYDYGGVVNWYTGDDRHINKNAKGTVQFPSILWPNMQSKKEIDYIAGCCMLVRRQIFGKIGLFDETYFFYSEDVDFCTRAKKAGFNLSVNPKVSIYHKRSGSIGLFSKKAIFYHMIGKIIFVTRHLGWRRPIGYLYFFGLIGKIIFERIIGRTYE